MLATVRTSIILHSHNLGDTHTSSLTMKELDESNAHNDRLCESGISAIAKNCFDVMYLKTDTEMFLRCLFRGMMNKCNHDDWMFWHGIIVGHDGAFHQGLEEARWDSVRDQKAGKGL